MAEGKTDRELRLEAVAARDAALAEKNAAIAAKVIADAEVLYQKDRSTRVDAIIFRLISVLPKYNAVDDQGVNRAAVLHDDLMAAVYDPVEGLDTIPSKP